MSVKHQCNEEGYVDGNTSGHGDFEQLRLPWTKLKLLGPGKCQLGEVARAYTEKGQMNVAGGYYCSSRIGFHATLIHPHGQHRRTWLQCMIQCRTLATEHAQNSHTYISKKLWSVCCGAHHDRPRSHRARAHVSCRGTTDINVFLRHVTLLCEPRTGHTRGRVRTPAQIGSKRCRETDDCHDEPGDNCVRAAAATIMVSTRSSLVCRQC